MTTFTLAGNNSCYGSSRARRGLPSALIPTHWRLVEPGLLMRQLLRHLPGAVPWLLLVMVVVAHRQVLRADTVIGLLYVLPMLLAAGRVPACATMLLAVATTGSWIAAIASGADGAAGWLASTAALVLAGCLCVLMSAQLSAARRAQCDATARLGDLQSFMGMVAHDLRGPLTTIGCHAQLLTRPSLEARHRERAPVAIREEVMRMDALLRDLVDAASAGAGTFKVEPRLVDLMGLAREIVEAQQVAAARHRLVLRGPALLETWADPERLAQALTNLIGNAAKYSPEGSEVLVTIKEAGSEAQVCVRDQGLGLGTDDLVGLFEPFSRRTSSRRIRGTGLGLFITRNIVEAHGGRIWASSPGADQGSTFTFSLPLRT